MTEAFYDGQPRPCRCPDPQLHRPSAFSASCHVCTGFLCIACGSATGVEYPHAYCPDCGAALARGERRRHG